MKNLLKLLVVALTLVVVTSSAQAQRQTIAFWDFNDGFAVENDTPQIVHNASIGTGTLYQQRADTDGNGKSGNDFADGPLAINVLGDRSIAWNDLGRLGDNDAEFFTLVSTLGFENIEISFDYRGNDDDLDGDAVNIGDGFTQFDARFSLVPLVDVIVDDVSLTQQIVDFNGSSTDLLPTGASVAVTNDSVNFQRILLAGPATVDNQSVFAFRIDEFNENDEVSFDNVLITGELIPVPEPTTFAWACLAGVGMLSRRRRTS